MAVLSMCGKRNFGFLQVMLAASHKDTDRVLEQVADVDVRQLSHALASSALWLE